jgi:hypothetical protein
MFSAKIQSFLKNTALSLRRNKQTAKFSTGQKEKTANIKGG